MEKASAGATVVTPEQTESLNIFGAGVEILLRGSDTDGAAATYRVTADPGVGSPPHVHLRDDETFYVLSGEFEFLCGGQVTTLAPGASIFLPRGIPHAFRNAGTVRAQMLGIGLPAGHEEFFEDASRLGQNGPPSQEEVSAVLQKHGMELAAPTAGS